MSLEILRKKGLFKTKQIWFADYPYDVKGVDRVIFRDCKNKADVSGFTCEKITTLIIDLTQNINLIWKNMSSGNCQKPIKRAERAGIKIKINQGYDEFYYLYKLVRETKSLDKPLKLSDIKKYATLFVAELDGKIISGHGYLKDDKNMRSWVIGSKRFNLNGDRATMVANAGKLIIWEAMKYAKNSGIEEFDFGGYYMGDKKDLQKEKINFFKKSFGGELTAHYNYRKDYSKIFNFVTKIYYKLK